MLKNTHASVNTLKHNPPQTCIILQCTYPHHWNTPPLCSSISSPSSSIITLNIPISVGGTNSSHAHSEPNLKVIEGKSCY